MCHEHSTREDFETSLHKRLGACPAYGEKTFIGCQLLDDHAQVREPVGASMPGTSQPRTSNSNTARRQDSVRPIDESSAKPVILQFRIDTRKTNCHLGVNTVMIKKLAKRIVEFVHAGTDPLLDTFHSGRLECVHCLSAQLFADTWRVSSVDGKKTRPAIPVAADPPNSCFNETS